MDFCGKVTITIWILICATISISSNSLNLMHIIHKTIKLLQCQHGKNVDSIVVISEYNEIDIFHQLIYHQLIPKTESFTALLYPKHTNYSYFNQDLKKFLTNYHDSLLMVYESRDSIQIRQVLKSLSREDFRKNIWLLIDYLEYPQNVKIDERQIFHYSNVINHDNIVLDSQIYTLSRQGNFSIIHEVYKICKDDDISIKVLHSIPDQRENETYQIDKLVERRKDLMGCELRVAYVDSYPYITRAKEEKELEGVNKRYVIKGDNELTMYGGSVNQIELIKLLKSDLNFTISWIKAEDNSYGVYNQEQNTWNGLVGLLIKNVADLSNAHLTVTPGRSDVISFSADFDRTQFGLFMAKPGITFSWSTFVDVFDKSYWIALCVIVFVIVFLLVAFFKNQTTFSKGRSCLRSLFSNFLSSTSMILLSLGSFETNIDTIRNTYNSKATRIIFFVICVLGMTNKEIYTGGLISTLLDHRYISEITSLEDLLEKPGYQLVLRNGGASTQYFSLAKESPHEEIWKEKLDGNDRAYVPKVQYAENLILADKKYVYFDIISQIEPIFDSYPCKMVRAKKTYFHRAVALGFRKDSPYLKLFNSRISYYRQNGLIANMAALKKDPKGSVKCTGSHFDPLGYKTVFSAFAVLGIGLAFAIFYSMFEFFCKC